MATCLVVDDSESMREVASEILRALGHGVQEAGDAVCALNACAQGMDVVFLDWDLPALGALDFLRGAAKLDPKPAIVLCATENDDRQFALARAVGAEYHVLKPFVAQDVAQVLAQARIAPVEAVA